MPLRLEALDEMAANAIRHFWSGRSESLRRQLERGNADQGNRSAVTSGKNLDGFVAMTRRIILDNGLTGDTVYTSGRVDVTLPGYFRPTKNWDLLVVSRGMLVAAIEFKSMVGSFGNNFNNRVEESLGNATDLLTAYREGAFGRSPRPFLGFVFILEEAPGSMRPVSIRSTHFVPFPEFRETSYARRYELLCRRLVQEQLYDSACTVLTNEADATDGTYREISEDTGLRRFAASLAGHVATVAAL